MIDFTKYFKLSTGNLPFTRKIRLYENFLAGRIASSCDIPTGPGKTSVIFIRPLAPAAKLFENPQTNKISCRLVYAPGHRVMIDQAAGKSGRKIYDYCQN